MGSSVKRKLVKHSEISEAPHQRDADLYRHFGATSPDSRTLEVDGGEGRLRDGHRNFRRASAALSHCAACRSAALRLDRLSNSSVTSQFMQASVIETPYLRADGSLPQRLAAKMDVALKHRANDLPASGCALRNDAFPDVRLTGGVLAGIRMTAIDHQRPETTRSS